jgi:hypothetical protein
MTEECNSPGRTLTEKVTELLLNMDETGTDSMTEVMRRAIVVEKLRRDAPEILEGEK